MLSMLGAGAAAAGLATLGNVVTGQAQEKSPGRLIAEALGAGALGAGAGATLGPGYMNRLVKAGSTSPKAEFALGTGIECSWCRWTWWRDWWWCYECSPR
jgi:hypothetical protein